MQRLLVRHDARPYSDFASWDRLARSICEELRLKCEESDGPVVSLMALDVAYQLLPNTRGNPAWPMAQGRYQGVRGPQGRSTEAKAAAL